MTGVIRTMFKQILLPTVLTSLFQHVVCTNFLNHDSLLGSIDNKAWYKQNIPFLEIPNQQIQEIYYFRWQTYKEHLVYSGAQYSYLSSEFLQPVSYGAPYGGIVAAAGHHINEGRWIRDQRYGKNVVNFWLSGPGQASKPATESLNPDTYDWAHQVRPRYDNHCARD